LSLICLGNPKVNGYSITEIFEVTTTLARVREITLIASTPLWKWPNLMRTFTLGGTSNWWPQWDHNSRTHWNTSIIFCAFPTEMCSLILRDSCFWHNQISQRKITTRSTRILESWLYSIDFIIRKGRNFPKAYSCFSSFRWEFW